MTLTMCAQSTLTRLTRGYSAATVSGVSSAVAAEEDERMCPMTSRFVYADDLTDEMIEALSAEAGVAGDDRMVVTCEQALAGDEAARERVASVISDARAQS